MDEAILTDHSPAFTETQTNTAHGRKYTYQVTGFYPGDSAGYALSWEN